MCVNTHSRRESYPNPALFLPKRRTRRRKKSELKEKRGKKGKKVCRKAVEKEEQRKIEKKVIEDHQNIG